MRALFGDLAVFENQNDIAVVYCAQTVSDEDRCPRVFAVSIAQKRPDMTQESVLGVRVKSRRLFDD